MSARKSRIGLVRGDLLVLGLLLLLAAALFVADRPQGQAVRAVIYAAGEIVDTVDLSAADAPYTIEVGGCTLSVRRGGIAFAASDCPDRLCVHRGEMTLAGDCMACVPNRVTVVLIGQGGADAVTG